MHQQAFAGEMVARQKNRYIAPAARSAIATCNPLRVHSLQFDLETSCLHQLEAMDSKELDSKINFAERRVLLVQSRYAEHKVKASHLLKSLERQHKELEEVKKEWIRKKNLEEERVRIEVNEIKKAHRHSIEDLRLRYEAERANKLLDIKSAIKQKEAEIEVWQRRRSEAVMETKAQEGQINAQNQAKINELLRDEQSASRRGVVRQMRLLSAPNVFSMNLEHRRPTGMKRRTPNWG